MHVEGRHRAVPALRHFRVPRRRHLVDAAGAVHNPGAIGAAADEILNVPERSPPVPHVSKTSAYAFESRTAFILIVRARPAISDGRSPFIVKPTSSPEICAGVASPLMMTAMASADSSMVRFSRRITLSSRPEIFPATLIAALPGSENYAANGRLHES